METNHEHLINRRDGERGNALIYVLIAIALFAALSMTLSRQTDTSEADTLPDERAELIATQMISYSAQVKSVIDQMLFTDAKIDNLDFTMPTAGGFNTPPNLDKVYHPEGGGLNPAVLPAEAIASNPSNNPPLGWYLGRFNNVEWTDRPAGEKDDVILVAYQISRQLCEKINMKIMGTTDIPTMTDSIKETMIQGSIYAGTNVDLSTDPAGSPICADCHKQSTLCVQDATPAYGFYTIIADQ